MNKSKLRKALLAAILSIIVALTSGCEAKKDKERSTLKGAVPSEYYELNKYYKFKMQNGEPVKTFDTKYIYVAFKKDTHEPKEYIFNNDFFWGLGGELYDMETEEQLAYSSGISESYNDSYLDWINENYDIVPMSDASNYVEGHAQQDSYTLAEVEALEPTILESALRFQEAETAMKGR